MTEPTGAQSEAPGPRELLCMKCGREHEVWAAANELWNKVMRRADGSDALPFVCASCFMQAAVECGATTAFKVTDAYAEAHECAHCGTRCPNCASEPTRSPARVPDAFGLRCPTHGIVSLRFGTALRERLEGLTCPKVSEAVLCNEPLDVVELRADASIGWAAGATHSSAESQREHVISPAPTIHVCWCGDVHTYPLTLDTPVTKPSLRAGEVCGWAHAVLTCPSYVERLKDMIPEYDELVAALDEQEYAARTTEQSSSRETIAEAQHDAWVKAEQRRMTAADFTGYDDHRPRTPPSVAPEQPERATVQIRIWDTTHEIVARLAEQTGATHGEVIAAALDRYTAPLQVPEQPENT